jgi:hypothetical protein
MQAISWRRARGATIVLSGDLACFLVFALLGLRSHEDGITFGGILRAAVPFQAGWLLLSTAVGLNRPGAPATSSRLIVRAWVPAWAAGLVIRTAVFGREFAPSFGIVALLVNGVLLLVWRCLAAPLVIRGGRV